MHVFAKPREKNRPSAVVRGGWVVVLLLAACGGSFAHLQPSREVGRIFEQADLPDTYRYYVIGSPYRPEAFIGVLPAFAPPSGGPWKPAPRGAQRRQTLHGMRFFDEERTLDDLLGAAIVLPDGRRAGIWYSARGRGAVKLDREGRLHVWGPRPKRMRLFRWDD